MLLVFCFGVFHSQLVFDFLLLYFFVVSGDDLLMFLFFMFLFLFLFFQDRLNFVFLFLCVGGSASLFLVAFAVVSPLHHLNQLIFFLLEFLQLLDSFHLDCFNFFYFIMVFQIIL